MKYGDFVNTGISFKNFGVMIDLSRNAVLRVSEMKRLMLILEKMGYNQLFLYMEDTYTVLDETDFGCLRGKYSLDELREIDLFAKEHGIEAIPCIQTLAHLGTIFKWNEYGKIRDIDDILLVGDERTYTLIENMIRTLSGVFSTDKIHIGMDEAHNLGLGAYLGKNGFREKGEILLEHLGKVCKIAEKYSRKPIIWSDMFYRPANGGEYYAVGTEFSDEIREKVPQNVSLVYWDYYHLEKDFYVDMIKNHKRLSQNIMFAGGAWKWSGLIPQNKFSIDATQAAISACVETGVEDVFITAWGDDGAEASVYSVLPTLCYAACIARGITEIGAVKEKFKEWCGADFDAFMLLDLPDYDETNKPEELTNPSKYQFYNDCFLGYYDKGGVYEQDAAMYCEIAEKLTGSLPQCGEYAYVFESIIKLCNVLELKADIGIRTRKAYRNNDVSALKDLIDDYNEILVRIEAFYKAFKKQWFKENKPFGFEVQDIRIGGLIMRVKSCRDRLMEYCDGNIDTIPELCEELPCLLEKKCMTNRWNIMVTPNVL